MIFYDVMALHERRPILLLPTTDKHPENEIDTKPLLALTHVCRYWRDVAIGTPALWTRVHGRHQEQMEAFLERSQSLPVTLFLDVEHQSEELDGTIPERIESVIRTQASRLLRLDLAMIPTFDDVVPLLACLPAPQLECLTIMSPLGGISFREIISWTRLFDNSSSLRALGLEPVVDWLPSSTLPHLTHLVLHFSPDMEMLLHPINLPELLSNTPALEFLHVDRLLFEGLDFFESPSDPVPLPHIHSLVFVDCPYKLLPSLLPRLILPEDIFIRLQTTTNNFPVQGPASPLPPTAIRPVTRLDVAVQGEELFMVADGPTSGLWLAAHHDFHDLTAGPQDWGEWLLGLHECLTLSHVTHLHIYVAGWETFWPAFLAHLPQVSHLTVLFGECSDDTGVCDSPTAILSEALSQENPILCPALTDLSIEWPHEITGQDFFSLPRLTAALKARSRAGHSIRRLVVQVPAESPLDSNSPGSVTFLEVHKVVRAARPYGTEYEVVEKPRTGKGLGAFEMREVWRVDGEDRYWEVDEHAKPSYNCVARLGRSD